MKTVAGLLGGGGSTPKVSANAPAQVEEDKKKAKKARSALLETEGGISGAELQPGQVSRDSLFGN